MGLFYKTRYEEENGKRYFVLQPNPLFRIMILLLPLIILFVYYFFIRYTKSLLGENFTFFIYIVFGSFMALIILRFIQDLRVIVAKLKKKSVIKKGGTALFDFKNPPETWIEQ
ncbi:MAG: hypothetical protein KKF44_07790 [Nanoarchaeota archaeon]|nr:hypothetical protein [Nanoarchaeota archaeon]